ncbi:SMC-Scp complex subunit ScpB [Pelotalea chapellei]|uniref:SMC-Scp complex subunit ScpB n=1 Tax=Pelotalea chapellei TaxID=44671 RepID=A0ABS5U7D0_9BACT|nr:SMC-Scp complex subunit ScpB [Pelotalea chapellei]MBT1071563.1 SMC-Scp complex subunit ScpB [Pelotalea chapellei]
MSLSAIVESIIFAAETPLSLDRLCDLLQEFERSELKSCLIDLAAFHEGRGGGFHLVEVAGGWQFRTRSEFQDYIVRHVRTRSAKFSPSALETLAIIAYRQPITRAEVEYLRGVDCGGVIKTLLDKKLIRILGKKEIPGRPLIYGTSKEFLETFGLKDLKALPTLKEIQALDETPFMELQEELPLDQNATQNIDTLLPFDTEHSAGS